MFTHKVWLPPTRSNSCSCSTLNSLLCDSRGNSAISSKKSVPLSASSNRPLRRSLAPVKAPFSCPNSSDSNKLGVKAAQFTLIKACLLRLLNLYKLRATSSLPVPFSPRISTVVSVSLTNLICSNMVWNTWLCPTSPESCQS